MMRRKWFSKLVVFLVVTCMMLSVFTACGNKEDEKEPTVADSGQTATTDKNEPTGTEKEPEKDDKDPFGKYDEPITLTTALRTFEASQKIPAVEDSIWFKKYAEYGINIEVEWSADASQYDNKVNTCIASGDIPDFMYIAASQPLTTLVKGDMVADVKDYFDYLSPTNKKWLTTGIGADALESVTFDGKVSMIPTNVTELINNCFPLFVRADWLNNLGLPIPKTIDDFKKVALAFTKDDPDKNGKDDTYGLTLVGQTNLICDWGGLYAFFGGYGVQPCTWYDGMLFYSKDENGNAVWDGTRPEVKEGLQLLADLYKEGAIPPDFPTMDCSKATEDLNGGKAGMVFGVRGLPIWAINNTIKNDPNTEWYAMNMPTKDGSPAPIFGFQPVNVGYVISKECKHPEAVMRLINIRTAYETDIESPLYDSKFDQELEKTGYEFIGITNPTKERTDNENFFEAVKNKDKSGLSGGLQDQYDRVMKYVETKDTELWSQWNAYYPEAGHAWYLTFGINTPDMVKKNVWWSLPTDKMVNKLPIFKKMAEEKITEIITGNKPVSEWDTMVKQWNKLGGDDITKEVQARMKK